LRIGVMGAGAIGSLFGGLLAESGLDVTLVTRRVEHVDAVNRGGLRLTGVSGERAVRVRATASPWEAGPKDLVILAVKSYDTEGALRDMLPMLGQRTTALTVQNGLGNVEKMASALGSERVLGGCTAHGATYMAPGEIRHAGRGPTTIGELDGTVTERVQSVAEVFTGAGIETSATRDIQGAIWVKLLVNMGINPLTAATGLRNGELLELEELRSVMASCVLEGWGVAKTIGIDLETNPVEEVFRVAEATAANRSSMLQDVERGVRTEIDFINGAVSALGRMHSVKTPVNDALVAVVKGLEAKARLRRAGEGSAAG